MSQKDTQTKSGETRQDLKIPDVSTRRLPRALSCSHHTDNPHHSAVNGRVFSFHAWCWVRTGGSLQAGL